jgi:murein L,D-transpeptidase YafK
MKKGLRILIPTFILCLLIYYFYEEEKIEKGAKIDKIIVNKSSRELITYSKGEIIKTFKISIGKNSTGKKEFKDDYKTPEGIYSISSKGPHKLFHKYLYVSYPNKNDILNAKKHRKDVGGQILIHGLHKSYAFIGKFHRFMDWTKGCMGMTNKEIDELYDAIDVGTPIQINP